MAGFVWGGNTGEKMTPQDVDRKRLAAALMAKQAGDTSPVASPFAGLNRALQGYLSGRDDKRAGAAEEAGLARGQAAMSPVLAALSGGGQASGGQSGSGYVPSGTWTPAPPKPSLTSTPGASGDLGFGGDVAAMPAAGGGGLAFGAPPMTPQEMIIAGAQARGLDPLDVATAISYETGGKFDPLIKGPTTQWGTHEGLIQFGDPQGDEYGAVFDQGPDVAMQSQLDPENGAVWKYLDKTGVVPGMGLDNIYSAINAGAPGRFNASDANNGGAAGTVAQKVAGMGDHRAKAAQFLGGTWTPAEGGQTTASTMGAPSGGNSDILGLLMQAQADPWAAQQYGPVLEALMGSELQARQRQSDPAYQLGLQKSQLELNQMQNAAPAPIEVGGVLLDPVTHQPIFDSRTQSGGDGFTLGAGQQRYDAAGNMIASGPEAAAPRPMNAQERQQWGIPQSDTRPYAIEPGKQPQLIGGGGTTINNDLGGGTSKQIFDAMDARSQIAQSASTALTALNEAESAVDAGIISGAGANQILGLQKVASAIGADPASITNTETFRAAMAPVVAATLKATAGTANLSNTDMEFAKQAAGGDVTLDSTSIKRLLGILRRANEGVVSAYKSRVDTVYPDGGGYDRERSIFGIAMPEAYGTQGAPAGSLNGNANQAPSQDSPAPAGVDPEDWKFMSPEEKALFQ